MICYKQENFNMGKLNQVIAIEKGVKSRVQSEVTDLYKIAQKPDLFNGFVKSYTKRDEDGEDLPSERKKVQFKVADVLRKVQRSMTELMDVTARKDWTNCLAHSPVTIDGKVLIEDAPISYLLFLEKQLTDFRTMANALPLLDEAEQWAVDPNAGLMRTEPIQTHRTKKVQKPIVLYDATDKHPAQTQLITEDVVVGLWGTVKHSGAMPKPDKEALIARIDTLLRAVKFARENANMADEEPVPQVGDAIFGYLLGS
jgi:hypothetical protein